MLVLVGKGVNVGNGVLVATTGGSVALAGGDIAVGRGSVGMGVAEGNAVDVNAGNCLILTMPDPTLALCCWPASAQPSELTRHKTAIAATQRRDVTCTSFSLVWFMSRPAPCRFAVVGQTPARP